MDLRRRRGQFIVWREEDTLWNPAITLAYGADARRWLGDKRLAHTYDVDYSMRLRRRIFEANLQSPQDAAYIWFVALNYDIWCPATNISAHYNHEKIILLILLINFAWWTIALFLCCSRSNISVAVGFLVYIQRLTLGELISQLPNKDSVISL